MADIIEFKAKTAVDAFDAFREEILSGTHGNPDEIKGVCIAVTPESILLLTTENIQNQFEALGVIYKGLSIVERG